MLYTSYPVTYFCLSFLSEADLSGPYPIIFSIPVLLQYFFRNQPVINLPVLRLIKYGVCHIITVSLLINHLSFIRISHCPSFFTASGIHTKPVHSTSSIITFLHPFLWPLFIFFVIMFVLYRFLAPNLYWLFFSSGSVVFRMTTSRIACSPDRVLKLPNSSSELHQIYILTSTSSHQYLLSSSPSSHSYSTRSHSTASTRTERGSSPHPGLPLQIEMHPHLFSFGCLQDSSLVIISFSSNSYFWIQLS